ncbi:5-(carboxyamino)imidazole ribonucleotide synthase [uncultured Bartonella sp.]|uniref:5-(carboxyamino)imidazole ribonucleotide synthase n=1 Tax=uncultured Bartonella sp. TaxID=104108 RepID=UPI0026153FE0|nr:5-(carboxyamino)imidazole ribonucleotide synthase [uncultured Bartonella sp.]
MKRLEPGNTIGFIGGGQLARMMAIAAARLGFHTIVLEPTPNCPASQTANRQIVANYDDEKALDELARTSDVITYEFENVPAAALDRLAKKALILPRPNALEVSQDRFTEKKFLNESGIKTAPWYLVDNRQMLIAGLVNIGGKGILKSRRMGYDGKGQVRLDSPTENAIDQALADLGNAPAILEGFVPFTKEISVIAARDYDGHVVFYGCPENVHRNGILRTSTVPATISEATGLAAKKATETILHELDYIGVIGVEFFVLEDGSVIANELAPRVHNSGHWTEVACLVSQFEQHIRAIAGLPLGSTKRHSNCVMENLIGNDISHLPELLAEPQTFIDLYGKAEVRSGRKMGHIIRLADHT